MSNDLQFDQVGRIPEPGDNAAIAIRRLEAGTRILFQDHSFALPTTVLEGHRFAVLPIATGEPLLSWGLPFGLALRDIAPGDYLCNETVLLELRNRRLDFPLPTEPNFQDHRIHFELDEGAFRPGQQVPPHPNPRTFDGYARSGGRGAGTRNFIVVMGTTSLTASYARLLAERFKDVPSRYPHIDGVVAVAHTEGGGPSTPNNLDFVLRTLAGFMVHPNVGAVIAIDIGTEPVTNARLERFMRERGYPLDAVPHRFLSLHGRYQDTLAEGATIVQGWLEQVNAFRRTPQPVAHLKIGLQCGGSDAFSGVSGNPLAGWLSKEIVRHGGGANLAETSELIGAEPYVLANVRDLATARKFLEQRDRFQQWAGWHGHSAEGNPSGGNLYRGLYNIVVKSIGAARKKDPDVRLDYCIDYSEPMKAPGYCFMDSPGNDLESIAGQVGAGCNLIVFTTGNGSITNFPFVPTIKIVTTTGRYELLSKEMDVNAGRYLGGEPLAKLGAETFDLTLEIASGQRSVGEQAGHSQVQLWREWRQTDTNRLAQLSQRPVPTGEPLKFRPEPDKALASFPELRFPVYRTERGWACDQIGLIVPTSLCAGQIAQLIAARLNQAVGRSGAPGNSVRRYVALAHTEGCGVSRGECEHLFVRTMVGYLCHPFVRHGLLLEHGCEKTHNDELRAYLAEHHIDPSRFGWASIQMDGGIDRVTAKVTEWFQQAAQNDEPATREAGWEALRLGLLADGPMPDAMAIALAQMARTVSSRSGTVVIPQNSPLLESKPFKGLFDFNGVPAPTLAYGEPFRLPGLHIMETPTDHLVETTTGLGATGVEVLLAHVAGAPLQSHPMIPMVQVHAMREQMDLRVGTADFDLLLDLNSRSAADAVKAMLELVIQVASRQYTPKLFALGNTDFQMTRGWVGVSL